MTIIDTKKIRELLNSDLTSYRVAQLTNVRQPVYYRYQKGQTPLENMTIKVASELMKIVEMEEKSMYTLKKEDLKNMELYFSWYNPEDGTTDLGFGPKGDIILRRVETPENVDEFYWDEPENVIQAIDEADEDDIEEK